MCIILQCARIFYYFNFNCMEVRIAINSKKKGNANTLYSHKCIFFIVSVCNIFSGGWCFFFFPFFFLLMSTAVICKAYASGNLYGSYVS